MAELRVKIRAEIFGKRKPMTVLLKIGLMRGGMEALIVKTKNEVDQRK